jgi:hypothetical protein
MTWIRLEDTFFTHPKIASLSAEAKVLHLAGLCYSSQHLTDGYIPSEVVPILLRRNHQRALNLLTSAGLWHTSSDGAFQIHGYLDYQTSRAQVEKIKETTRKRVEKHRNKKLGIDDGNAHVTPLQKVGNALVTQPEPEPHTEPEPELKDKRLVQIAFERFWDLYPRKQGKAKAKGAFEKAMKKSSIEEILAGLENYKATISDPQFVAMPATWLNGERWNDEALPKSNVLQFAQTKNVPHSKLIDPHTSEPYCQSCGQSWPCLTESKKGQANF